MLSNYYQTTYSAIRAILPDVWIIIMVRSSCRVGSACILCPTMAALAACAHTDESAVEMKR